MRLIAQRVRNPAVEGIGPIQTFHYAHGLDYYFPNVPTAADLDVWRQTGQLVAYHAPFNDRDDNAVLSHLEVVAPDDTPSESIRQHLGVFIAQHLPAASSPPWIGFAGPCWFIADTNPFFRHAYRLELPALLDAALNVRRQNVEIV